MNLRDISDREAQDLEALLRKWAVKQHSPAGGREALLRTVVRASFQRRPHRVLVFIQGLARPYWSRRPQMSYTELSKWLFNRAMIETHGATRPELRLVT